MDGPRERHTERAKSDRECKYHVLSPKCESKIWYKWTYLQNKQAHRLEEEQKLRVTRGESGGG